MAHKLELKDGKLIGSGDMLVDGNQDGEPSVKAKLEIEVDAAEAVEEIVKKDLGWLKKHLAGLGVKIVE